MKKIGLILFLILSIPIYAVHDDFMGNSVWWTFSTNNDKYGIFVPDNLVDVYKADTNWAPAAENIKPLSQLPTE